MHTSSECQQAVQAIHDALYVLGGKWKIQIVGCLLAGPRKYSELLRKVPGISGKMLSRELKELEINSLLKRLVSDTHPVTVRYELTTHGESLEPVVRVLAEWGVVHRKHVGATA